MLVSAANVLVSKSVSELWPALRSCACEPLLAMSPTRMPQINSVEAKMNGNGLFIRVMMPNLIVNCKFAVYQFSLSANSD